MAIIVENLIWHVMPDEEAQAAGYPVSTFDRKHKAVAYQDRVFGKFGNRPSLIKFHRYYVGNKPFHSRREAEMEDQRQKRWREQHAAELAAGE